MGDPKVTALADDLLTAVFDADPIWSTLAGVPGWDDRLADPSEAGERATVDRLRTVGAAAARVDPAPLDPTDRLTLDVVSTISRDLADEYALGVLEWQVTDLYVAPCSGLLTYLPESRAGTPQGAADYRSRLAAIEPFLAALAQRHLTGIEAGRTPVARLARAAVAQLDDHLADPAGDPLRRPFADLPDATALDAVLADVVRPALARYRDVLADRVAPAGRDDEHPGLCQLPGGDAQYRTLVRVHTTTDRTPDDLHRTGLDLIERLAAEYAELGKRVFGETDQAEIIRRLREDPELRCTSAEQMLTEARDAVARAEAAAPAWFGDLPPGRCEVLATPAADEAHAPGAYYSAPALDGSRPGRYFQNTRNPTEQVWHMLQNAAFHEAVPGHHLQAIMAASQAELPKLRRFYQFDGFDEGWGLYAERLAEEMGLFSSDLARFGMLAGDSVRAARLVVDTGLHALGWSRQRALDYMLANTPWPRSELEMEVNRYIAYPGQALAYMTGRLEIQRLRAAAESRLGAAFDIRGFHRTVLGIGSVPLTALARTIDDWAAEQ
jgi:uncharacterized protein (DUF885 family)